MLNLVILWFFFKCIRLVLSLQGTMLQPYLVLSCTFTRKEDDAFPSFTLNKTSQFSSILWHTVDIFRFGRNSIKILFTAKKKCTVSISSTGIHKLLIQCTNFHIYYLTKKGKNIKEVIYFALEKNCFNDWMLCLINFWILRLVRCAGQNMGIKRWIQFHGFDF